MYGVIDSITRKFSKIYGVIDDITANISKIYTVVDGVTRLVFESFNPILIFTASTTYTIPVGIESIDIFCVGGGGGGGGARIETYKTALQAVSYNGSPGGGGYTATKTGISVSEGDVLTITVGAGGTAGNRYLYYNSTSHLSSTTSAGGKGGTTSVKKSSTTLCTANGGYGGKSGTNIINSGANGGSGSHPAGYYRYQKYSETDYQTYNAYYYQPEKSGFTSNGGSSDCKLTYQEDSWTYDDGYVWGANSYTESGYGGKGQGTTTRAWGIDSSENTLYAYSGSNYYGANPSANGSGGLSHWHDAPSYSNYNGAGIGGIVIIRLNKAL